jgi:hypothetical protein
MGLNVIFLIVAIVLFAVAATGFVERFNLIAAGLAFFAASFVV